MDNPQKAGQLTAALIIAERELREKFRENPDLNEEDADIIRRDTYLEIVETWLEANS